MADTELRIRRRTRLRDKESASLRAQVAASLGLPADAPAPALWDPKSPVEVGEFLDRRVVLVNNQVHALLEGPEAEAAGFLTVRGLLAYKPQARYVTVDMGAVKFVANGADIMAPGIVDADKALQPGDWCWIRDERNKQPLAVGKAIVPGAAMIKGKGKAVKSVHYLGDKLWNVEI